MSKPFPWRCRVCCIRKVYPRVARRELSRERHGKRYTFVIEQLSVPMCEECDTMHFDKAANAQIQNQLTRHINGLKEQGNG